MASAYITPSVYERAATGLDTAPYLGIVGHLANAQLAGDTSLTLGQAGESFPTDLEIGDQITVFDGAQSEQVRVTDVPNVSASTVTVSPLVYPHLTGVEYCTDGDDGSLGDMLLRASARIDALCNQSLLYNTYTETLPLQTMEASISRTGTLTLRLAHTHVQSIVSLSVNAPYGYALPIDLTQLVIERNGRIVTLPVYATYGVDQGNLYSWNQPVNSMMQGTVIVSYTAGYLPDKVPYDVQEACILYTSVALARKSNPLGVAATQAGKQRIEYFLRGDTSGKSSVERAAETMLMNGNYVLNAW